MALRAALHEPGLTDCAGSRAQVRALSSAIISWVWRWGWPVRGDALGAGLGWLLDCCRYVWIEPTTDR